HINVHHHYNYVTVRNSTRAVAMHGTRRGNAYEVKYPERSFTHRNNNVTNRYELDQTRVVNSTRNTTTSKPSASINRPTTASLCSNSAQTSIRSSSASATPGVRSIQSVSTRTPQTTN